MAFLTFLGRIVDSFDPSACSVNGNFSCITLQIKEQELYWNVTLIICKSASNLNDIGQTQYFHVNIMFSYWLFVYFGEHLPYKYQISWNSKPAYNLTTQMSHGKQEGEFKAWFPYICNNYRRFNSCQNIDCKYLSC